MDGLVFIALNPPGLETAQKAKAALGHGEIHGLEGRTSGADVTFEATGAHLRELFNAGRPIIAFMASGAVIRILASELADKHQEPPVIAVSLDGAHIVPLLGGHHGGNKLANALAQALDGQAAITTGSDSILGAALDDPPDGWRLEANGDAKLLLQAAITAGGVRFSGSGPQPNWLTKADAGPLISVGDAAEAAGATPRLIPPTIAIGVGCERDTPPDALIEHVRAVLLKTDLHPASVAVIASIDVKADEVAVHALGAAFGVPARFFGSGELRQLAPRLRNPSAVVLQEVGIPGVAEAAALAAAGPGATLIVPKVKGAQVTTAIARAVLPIAAKTVGRPQGALKIVGLGPGDPAFRVPAATDAIRQAEDIVGYGLYLDLAADAISSTTVLHPFPLGAERDRARHALALAATGRRVALLASGDPGVYALATLALEEMDAEDNAEWNRINLDIIPGVSAMQMAAARTGAPLGHDFCAISLSDLLTPWATIEQRLNGAAIGDFVIAFYNPVSKRRREGLIKARDILLAHRPANTPIAYARNLGRPEESIVYSTLEALTPDACDMLTTIIVGSSRTRQTKLGGHDVLYTPRGYISGV